MKKQIIHITFLIFTIIICSSSSTFSQRLRIVFNLSADTLHQCTVILKEKMSPTTWKDLGTFRFEAFYWSRNIMDLKYGTTYKVVATVRTRKGFEFKQETKEFTYEGQNILAELNIVIHPGTRNTLIPIIHEVKIPLRPKE